MNRLNLFDAVFIIPNALKKAFGFQQLYWQTNLKSFLGNF